MPVVLTAITAVLIWGALLANGGALPKEAPPGPSFTPSDFPLTHLWFLYALLLCYAVTLVVRGVAAAIDRRGRLRVLADRGVRVLMSGWAPVLLAVPLCLALYFQSEWFMWFGIPTPDRALYPNLPAAVGFGSAFALGWLLHRQAGLLGRCELRWPLHLSLAVVATGVCLSIVGIAPALVPAAKDAKTFAYAACYAVAAWSWTFALIGLAMRSLSGYSAVRRYLADASYWMYLIHLPLVMALQTAAARIDWPWFVKFPLVLAVAFAAMLLSYQWLVRGTFIGAVLNGRRKRARDATAAVADSARAE